MSMTTDFLLDATGDLAVVGGDLAVGDGTWQNKELLLSYVPGELRQHPTTGVGIALYLESNQRSEVMRASIMREFTNDGLKVELLQIKNDGTIIERSSY